MKNLRFVACGLALVTLAACVNLDEQLVGTVTTTYFTTPAGLEAAVDGRFQTGGGGEVRGGDRSD